MISSTSEIVYNAILDRCYEQMLFLLAPGLLSAGPTMGEGEMPSILPQPVPP